MKKIVRFLSIVLSAGLLASCNGAPLPYDQANFEDSDIDTPYSEYVLPVTSISFPETEKSISLNKGETHSYKFTLEPKRAEAKGVRWLSDDDSIATINNGELTAIGGGKTNIRVSSPDDIFDEVSLNVEVIVPLTAYEVPESVNLGYNKTYQISPVLTPADSTQGQFTFTPSNSLVASVDDNGLVTTNAVDGVCSIGVTSLALGTTKYVSFNVSEVHATSVTIDDSVTTLEVGKSMKINATVAPSDAYEQAVVFSIDETSIANEVASISEDGTLSAYKEGTVTITATNVLKPELHDSFDVTIFQVRADHINQDDVVLSNLEPTYQLNPTYVDSSDNPVQPSIKKTTYQLMTVGAIELSETGLITFVEKGNAIVRIHDEELSGSTFKDVSVTCSLVASSVSISGSKSVYIGDSIELTVSSNPERASLSDGSISIEATGGREFATLDTSLLESQGKVTVSGKAAGTITLVATIGGVNSQAFSITVANKPFESGKAYLVGNRNYSSGTAVTGDSWNDAGQAFEFENIGGEGMIAQHKARVYLTADSLFKVRHDVDGWCNIDDTEGKYDPEHGSSLETGDVVIDTDQDGYKNIKVVTSGSYDIYYKLYSSQETPSGTWWEVYIMQTPTLSLSTDNVNVKVGSTVTIYANNYDAPLGFASSASSVATAAQGESNKVVISGVSAGTATITVTDNTDHVATCSVLVTDRVFEDNIAYLVGDHDYSSGTSASGASWSNADKALLMNTNVSSIYGGDLTMAVRGEITFNVGDVWKVRVGDFFTQKESWVEGDPWYQIGKYDLVNGTSIDGTEFRNSAFATGDVAFDNENNNVVVQSAGTYYVDYIHWNNEHTEGWYEVRISKKPTLALSETNVLVAVGEYVDVTASNVEGILVATSAATGTATANVNGNTIRITGVAANSTTVAVHDDAINLVINVTVEDSVDRTFHAGEVYVLGDHDYSSGTSASGSSWGDATKAYHIGAQQTDVDQDAFIYFNHADEWKVKVGDDGWVSTYNIACDGMTREGEGNVVVNTAGWYRVIYKHTTSTDTVTVCKFGVDKNAISVSAGGTATFNIHDWKNPLQVVSNNTDIATVAVVGAVATVTGVAAGSTTITVSDGTGTEFIVSVTVTATKYRLYFDATAKSWWADGSAETWVYMYDSTGVNAPYAAWKGTKMIVGGTRVYYIEIEQSDLDKYDSFIFLRVNPGDGSVWNRTSKDGGIAIAKPSSWSSYNCWTVSSSWNTDYEYDDGNYTGSWTLKS